MRRSPELRLGAAALAVAAVVATAAQASVVPGVSLAGIRVDDTQARVRQVLGAAKFEQHVGSPAMAIDRWDYPAHNRLTIYFRRGKVTTVTVSAVAGQPVLERTSRGVGLGSTIAQVAHAYPGACPPPHPPSSASCVWKRGTIEMRFDAQGTAWTSRVGSILLRRPL